jgi:GxxExxY protein
MPIEVSSEIQVCYQEEFHALDHRIMGVVFDVHNEFGRLLDEELYKQEIAARCVALGLTPAEREVRIRVSHGTFAKDYRIDLLFCHGFMLEAKTAESLAPSHRAQVLNYILLTGMRHARLINLRTERAQHEYVSTTLTPEERHRFQITDPDWVEMDAESQRLRTTTIALLEDWGAFLDVNLYREALIHFLGGQSSVCMPVEIFSGSRRVGTQKLNLVNGDTAFAFTMIQAGIGAMSTHLDRLLHHTPLKCLQWVNLYQHRLAFTTIQKRNSGRLAKLCQDRGIPPSPSGSQYDSAML